MLICFVRVVSVGNDSVQLVSPFDHPVVWEGNASLVDEVLQDFVEGDVPDLFICSVGGGGLFAGLLLGIERQPSMKDVSKILAVETHGASSFNTALQKNKLVSLALDEPIGIAHSLGARKVSPGVFDLATSPEAKDKFLSVTVSDREAMEGCKLLLDEHRFLVEPACGVVLSAARNLRQFSLSAMFPTKRVEDLKIVLVICGGSAMTMDLLRSFEEEVKEQ